MRKRGGSIQAVRDASALAVLSLLVLTVRLDLSDRPIAFGTAHASEAGVAAEPQPASVLPAVKCSAPAGPERIDPAEGSDDLVVDARVEEEGRLVIVEVDRLSDALVLKKTRRAGIPRACERIPISG